MKLKKLLSSALAVALAIPFMTAFAAADTTTSGVISGDSTYVDTEIYQVTLPTSADLGFNLDPLGLFGYFAENDTENTADASDLEAFKGKIVGTGYDTIVNESSVPVAITCDYTLTSGVSNLKVVTDDSEVTDDGNEVYLTIVDGTYADSTFKKGSNAVAVGTTSTKQLFVLDAADYEFTNTDGDISYSMVSDSGKSTYFAIDGLMSAEGDWSALETTDENTLKLSCVYTFAGVKDSSQATVDDTTGFVTAGAESIEYITEPEVLAYTATYSKAAPSTVSVDVGFEPTSVKVIEKLGQPLDTTLNTTNHYSISGTTITLNATWLTNLAVGEWVIELSDGDTTKTLTLTVEG